jgi:transcriptional regulator with XRE-family HTH domain
MKKQRTTQWEAAVGTRLQELRLGKGLSQSQLAKLAGVPFRSLQNYEQGHRPMPLETANRLVQALGLTLNDLVPTAVPKKKGGK